MAPSPVLLGKHHCRAEQKHFLILFILESEGFTGIITPGNKMYMVLRAVLRLSRSSSGEEQGHSLKQ